MKYEVVKTDITVVGGGLAGVCAAVAAARLGRTVSLVQNRPVLGGNSSSEVRVWVCGATAHGAHRYARETGVMGELFIENQFHNIDGNPYFWDVTILETVRAENNIQLFLNTDVHDVDAEGHEENRSIRSVTGWMMGSERRIRFESEMFLDCTGDGLVGFLAGAKYRIGREARHEFNEEWAPESADDITLGSTILFYTKDVGHPVKYKPPSFAKDITQTSIPMKRVIQSGDNGCSYWWIEWGGELDTVHNNEQIRDELWSAIYGIWDYIKNSGKFDADNMTLEWVGALPGKREYRRFIGDYVLNQNDIVAQRPFEDRIGFGGWSIDLHPPQGMYSTESGSKHLHVNGIYQIPFRSLYSINTSNLLFAGRDISASHVAFGTTRVMATCAVIGEAAGTGAALAVEKGVSPRELYTHHMKELQQLLMRQDASIIGLKNEDPLDQALKASISASSTLTRIAVENPIKASPLTMDVGLLFPVEPGFDSLELLVGVTAATELQVELWRPNRAENYVPEQFVKAISIPVSIGEQQWVKCDLSWKPDEVQNAFIIIKANENVTLYTSDQPQTGVLCFSRGSGRPVTKELEDTNFEELIPKWPMRHFHRTPICFRLDLPTSAFNPAKVINGYNRPYGGPHMWSSEAMVAEKPEWLELTWQQPVNISSIHITLNDDVNEDLINLHHHLTPFEVIPELVKDYKLQAWSNGEWITLATETNNYKRKHIYQLNAPVHTDRIRLVIASTNGCPRAEVVEIRVYEYRS
ncbi:FAD-dependent oxidoreductase [Paenibacillus chungangensis]|uniref:FAD-dependent oxidoreductase n=1 Tax=Paenibacillus chungangensis TaxID=696535 RepID=A0ABW3HR23_9BACL